MDLHKFETRHVWYAVKVRKQGVNAVISAVNILQAMSGYISENCILLARNLQVANEIAGFAQMNGIEVLGIEKIWFGDREKIPYGE